ncbi:hypothetical protein SAY86_010156 [Trapa natans]|uniref:Uncharacterized protein n=1 Tax=Trapa natans TaxID=22666 RepID=A0AAN7L5U0_TRANT|nr:hypothetical protein SAY86_010156 [Trapa natans]
MGGTSFSSISSRSSSSVSSFAFLVVVVTLTFIGARVCDGGKTSTFVREVKKIDDMPLDSYNAPQQVLATYLLLRLPELGSLFLLEILGAYYARRSCGQGRNRVVGNCGRTRVQRGALLEQQQPTEEAGQGQVWDLQVLQLHFWVHPPLHGPQFGSQMSSWAANELSLDN